MVSIRARTVLRHLRRLSGHSTDYLVFIANECRVVRLDDRGKCYDCSKYSKEIGSLLRALAKDGYIELAHESTKEFCVTDRGLHLYELDVRSAIRTLINSFLIPIAVAFATALITVKLNLPQ